MGTGAVFLVSPVGIEPTTNWLKASCSTTELRAREPTPYGPCRGGAGAVVVGAVVDGVDVRFMECSPP
jgi:hypothetical protein